MVGLISRIKGMQAFSIGAALILLQGLMGVEHMLLTLGLVATAILFAVTRVSGMLERIGMMVFIIFLAVVGIGGLSKVAYIPSVWASISEPLMIWATIAGLVSGVMMLLEVKEK